MDWKYMLAAFLGGVIGGSLVGFAVGARVLYRSFQDLLRELRKNGDV